MKYAGTRDYCTCGLFYIDISDIYDIIKKKMF